MQKKDFNLATTRARKLLSKKTALYVISSVLNTTISIGSHSKEDVLWIVEMGAVVMDVACHRMEHVSNISNASCHLARSNLINSRPNLCPNSDWAEKPAISVGDPSHSFYIIIKKKININTVY